MRIKVLVIQEGRTFDMSELVSSVRWSGRCGSPARNLQIEFVDDSGYGRMRSNIDVTKGHQCIFSWDESELFRGMFIDQIRSNRKSMSASAYDLGIYLSNNQDTFNYTNRRATDIFNDITTRFRIPVSTTVDTVYRIPELPKPRASAWNVLSDSLSLTRAATGVRYYVRASQGAIGMFERRLNILQWVIETGANLTSYEDRTSIAQIQTHMKILSREGSTVATATNSNLENFIGRFQGVDTLRDEMNAAQLNTFVRTKLKENNRSTKRLSVTALGIPEIISGVGVHTIITDLDLVDTFYVDEDIHTFDRRHHSMTVKLEPAFDANLDIASSVTLPPATPSPAPGAGAGASGTAAQQSSFVVEFLGGSHFTFPNSTGPVGGARRAGRALCIETSPGARQPYNLIGGLYNNVGGTSNVNGWVSAGLVRRV